MSAVLLDALGARQTFKPGSLTATLNGVVTDESTLPSGDPQPVDTRALAGRHRHQMPLTDQILSFG